MPSTEQTDRLKGVLSEFVAEGQPLLGLKQRRDLVDELTLMIQDWAAAKPADRNKVLKTSKERIARKFHP